MNRLFVSTAAGLVLVPAASAFGQFWRAVPVPAGPPCLPPVLVVPDCGPPSAPAPKAPLAPPKVHQEPAAKTPTADVKPTEFSDPPAKPKPAPEPPPADPKPAEDTKPLPPPRSVDPAVPPNPLPTPPAPKPAEAKPADPKPLAIPAPSDPDGPKIPAIRPSLPADPTLAPLKLPTDPPPAKSESRSSPLTGTGTPRFEVFPVAGPLPTGATRTAHFHNRSARAVSLTVQGETISLPPRTRVTARVPASFAWSLDAGPTEPAEVPADSPGVEVLIRR